MATSFYARSMGVMTSLWGLVFVLILAVTYLISAAGGDEIDALLGTAPFLVAAVIALIVVFLQFLISPFLLDLQMWWVYDMTWINPQELPKGMFDALMATQEKYRFRIGKVGVIHDGMPNAFTYGHFRNNARIVITEGILDILDEDEQVAVFQHELGHVVNRDFIFMTIAQAVPLILYIIYITSRSFGEATARANTGTRGGGSSNQGQQAQTAVAGGLYGIAALAYIFYFISRYIVLLLSRYREHFADEFSALETGNANALSSALVKIAYGMVTDDAKKQAELGDKDLDRKRRRQLQRQSGYGYAMRTMGIADINTAKGLVMQAYTAEKEVSADAVAAAATWDLMTPWAKFIELSSTHPLTGKRLLALDQMTSQVGQTPKYPSLGTAKPEESLWDEFLVDLFFHFGWGFAIFIIPAIGAGIGALFGNVLMGLGIGVLIIAGLAFVRIGIKFPGSIDAYNNLDRPANTVVEALTDLSKDGYIEASPIRGKPIVLQGQVQGRGMPGMIFGEDFMVRDKTGFVVVDYNSVIPFMNFWFGWRRVRDMMGEEVRVVGWYHRHMRPMVRLHKLYRPGGQVHSNRWRGWARFWAFALVVIGILFIVLSFGGTATI